MCTGDFWNEFEVTGCLKCFCQVSERGIEVRKFRNFRIFCTFPQCIAFFFCNCFWLVHPACLVVLFAVIVQLHNCAQLLQNSNLQSCPHLGTWEKGLWGAVGGVQAPFPRGVGKGAPVTEPL